MQDDEWVSRLRDLVADKVRELLRGRPLAELASLDRTEELIRSLMTTLTVASFDVWAGELELAAVTVARACPGCGADRKCKRRKGAPMEIRALGVTVALPKPYLECARCDAPGVSISALLTGLSDGSTSAELELRAGYSASQHSYGKAKRDLAAHYGETLERTKLRRVSLEVEAHAVDFAERARAEALRRIGEERRTVGVATLMLQGDGGIVRTGKLAPCEKGDAGFGKKTAVRGVAQRKRETQYRELMTFDVRVPGASEVCALDVLVPVHAAQGERARRMLALAARHGLGDNTEVIGLGDMGSGMPVAFGEAFVGYPKSHWYTDWHHACDYVRKAGEVLQGLDVPPWREKMRQAIWNRDEHERDRLLRRARKHRVPNLPAQWEKCPVATLTTYLTNNWDHLRSAELKARGFDYVSARAEAQVRDRTQARFAVPGAWLSENLEGKATLRAIIDEGCWAAFRADYLRTRATKFQNDLALRLEHARTEGRISSQQMHALLGTNNLIPALQAA